MQQKIISFFKYSAGILLLLTAVAKMVSANGSAKILQNPDPVLSLPFRDVFWGVGIIEIFVAFYCLFGKRLALATGLVGWLASGFLIYRFGLVLVDYHSPCSCLGNLTDALNIRPQTADTAMKIILAYLLLGSYAALLWLWRQKRQSVSATAVSGTSAPSQAP